MATNVILPMHADVILPQCATQKSAGYDVQAYQTPGAKVLAYTPRNNRYDKAVNASGEIFIDPSERVLIPTGLTFNLDDDSWVGVYPRSGLSLKEGLTLTNNVGVIDSDYKDELFVSITNRSSVPVKVTHGDKVAQLVLHKVYRFDDLSVSKTERNGGFGSTGVGEEVLSKLTTKDNKTVVGYVDEHSNEYVVRSPLVNNVRAESDITLPKSDISTVGRVAKADVKRHIEAYATA